MKKRLASLLALMIGTATPSIAQDIWAGDMFITGKSGNCSQYDPVGSHHYVRYLPRTTGNGTNAKFALFQNNNYAQSFVLSAREFDSTERAVVYTSLWADAGALSPHSTNPPAVKVAFSNIARTPSSTLTTPSTIFMQVTGVISNYDPWTFTRGCKVTFRMALGKSTN